MMMADDKVYQETKEIKLGKKEMNPEFKPLADWIDKTYKVKTLNIFYDLIEEDNLPRLEICFENQAEVDKFRDEDGCNYESSKQQAISKKFKQTLKDQKIIVDTGFFGFLKKKVTSRYIVDNLLVVYAEFKSVAKSEVINSISDEQIELLKTHLNNPDIWAIERSFERITFFLYTDSQVEQYKSTKEHMYWTERFIEFLNKHDQFGYFKKDSFLVALDSKENFDKNYGSNWGHFYN